ncbi:MAG: ABC transporter ATP-binding protein [Planctomycetia bacterium]|nr:ABC transporter ATP-binding protein [Planctomycetia bacterium]
MNQPATTLDVRDLVKTYDTASGSLTVLKNINLRLFRGEAIAVTGPSGSGKSSLLFVLGAMEVPNSGEIELQGRSLNGLTETQLAVLRQQQIGFVFQEHHLLPQCTVLENVLIPLLAGGGTKLDDVERARQLLDRVGLRDRLDHRPAQLSGGERQRVAVCRALINQPALLLADEPTGNLDRANADSIGSLLLELCRDTSSTLICVTHSTELAARFPRRAELRDGILHEMT